MQKYCRLETPFYDYSLSASDNKEKWMDFIVFCTKTPVYQSLLFLNEGMIQNENILSVHHFFSEIFAVCSKVFSEGYGLDYIGNILSSCIPYVGKNKELLCDLSTFVYTHICGVDHFEIMVTWYEEVNSIKFEKKVNVNFGMKICDAKNQICNMLGVSQKKQRIVFEKKILNKNNTVLECGLTSGNKIFLMKTEQNLKNKIKVSVECVMFGNQNDCTINLFIYRADTIRDVKNKINHCVTMQTSCTMKELDRNVCGQRIVVDGKFLDDDDMVYETTIPVLKFLTNIYMEEFNNFTANFMLKPISTIGNFHTQKLRHSDICGF